MDYYRCEACLKTSSEEDWNEATYAEYGEGPNTRVLPKAYEGDESVYLVCPKCETDDIDPTLGHITLVDPPVLSVDHRTLYELLEKSNHPLTLAALKRIRNLEQKVRSLEHELSLSVPEMQKDKS